MREFVFHNAAAEGNIERMKKLRRVKGFDVDAKDFLDGTTALHRAAFHGQVRAAELLISWQADVNARDNNGATPLHYATTYRPCSCKMVELLIKAGADVNAKDKDGRTPLHGAASLNEHKIVELLIAKGADVNAKDEAGGTPLQIAIGNNAPEAAEVLRKHGATE